MANLLAAKWSTTSKQKLHWTLKLTTMQQEAQKSHNPQNLQSITVQVGFCSPHPPEWNKTSIFADHGQAEGPHYSHDISLLAHTDPHHALQHSCRPLDHEYLEKSLNFSNPWIQNEELPEHVSVSNIPGSPPDNLGITRVQDVLVHCLQARVHCRQATAVLPHNVPLHKHHPPHPPAMGSTPLLSVRSTDDSDILGGVAVHRPHDVDDALQGSLRQVVTNLKQKTALTILFFENRGDNHVALPVSELVHGLHQQHALLLLRHQLVTLPVCVTSQLLRCYKNSQQYPAQLKFKAANFVLFQSENTNSRDIHNLPNQALGLVHLLPHVGLLDLLQRDGRLLYLGTLSFFVYFSCRGFCRQKTICRLHTKCLAECNVRFRYKIPVWNNLIAIGISIIAKSFVLLTCNVGANSNSIPGVP